MDREPAVEQRIEGRRRDLGGFEVRRVLPAGTRRRSVGPFVFFDEFGPADLAPGDGLDVRPHPHIGLTTATYLLAGEIIHRDSLGSEQPVRPGELSWMTAGRGIVHSERTGAAVRASGGRLHGLQTWIALPRGHEDTPPAYEHHPAGSLPEIRLGDARVRLVAGDAYGARGPVRTFSPMFFVDVQLPRGKRLALPDEHRERAVYPLAGRIAIAGAAELAGAAMSVLRPGAAVEVEALEDARLVVLGGAPLDGDRLLWWNFVSSSAERIEQAKRDWRDGRFAAVPGDAERAPLPDA